MSTEAIKLVREEGKEVHQGIGKEFHLNFSGQKSKTEINEILKSSRELLDPEVFQSLKETSFENKEKINAIRLILDFLAETILLSKSAQIQDGILETEASSYFSSGKSRIYFRASEKALLQKSKKYETKEILENRNTILSKLNELYLRQYAYLQKDSHDLGFSSYLELYEFTQNHSSTELVESAKQLLRDTEYISRELLTWFLDKKVDLKLKDASASDLFYLLNSNELKDSFPKLNTHSLAQAILDETKIDLPAIIKFDTEKRKGHKIESIPYIYSPGVEMLISTNLMGGIWDYESFLKSFGYCLCYGFTNRDDYFEYTHLRENSLLMTFSELFKNLVYEPDWLKKHIKVDPDADYIKFLFLRRLIITRILCAKVIFETALYNRQDDKKEMYKEIMEIATHCKSDTKNYLFDIRPHLSSLDEFKGSIFEAQLRVFMIDNFDEQWWRNKEASDQLLTFWESGGRISTGDVSQDYHLDAINISKLVKTFEEILG